VQQAFVAGAVLAAAGLAALDAKIDAHGRVLPPWTCAVGDCVDVRVELAYKVERAWCAVRLARGDLCTLRGIVARLCAAGEAPRLEAATRIEVRVWRGAGASRCRCSRAPPRSRRRAGPRRWSTPPTARAAARSAAAQRGAVPAGRRILRHVLGW
jgi:hypothetical protein